MAQHRVLICGNCAWPEVAPIREIMEWARDRAVELNRPIVYISGMAAGADTIADEEADDMDEYCDRFPWNKWGERKNRVQVYPAEPHGIRNQWMLDSGVTVCYAFAYNLRVSYGTRDMVCRCLLAGVPCFWYDGKDWRKVPKWFAEMDYKRRQYASIEGWEVVDYETASTV